MNERMTIRTYNHQIISFIVFSISVYVVDSQNFFNFIIPTFFAFLNYPSSYPKSPEIIRFIRKFFICMSGFISTRFRAIFPFSTRRISYFLITQQTSTLNTPAIYRTPFSSFYSVFSDVKNFRTILTTNRMHYAST